MVVERKTGSRWHALVRIAIFCNLLLLAGALAQAQDKKGYLPKNLIVIEEPRIFDERLEEKGITGRSFAETLRFILSGEPDLITVLAGLEQNQTKPDISEFRLSSSIQRFQNLAVWTGEIAGPGGIFGRVGPVTVMDETGLRSGALSEIPTLIQAQLRHPSSKIVRSVEITIGCFKQVGPIASLVIQELQTRLRIQVENMPGIHWGKSASRDCRGDSRSPDESIAILNGRIEGREKNIAIAPVLSWRSISLSLPMYTGSLEAYFSDRDEYFGLTAKAIGSIVHEYPIESVLDAAAALSSSEIESVMKGRLLLSAGRPFLALPLLQRGATLANADTLHDLGTAYQDVSAPRHAEKSFRQAIQIEPNHGPSHRDLGTILFDQRKYQEAAREFESAGNTPGAREKYATVLYLLGEQSFARRKAEEALAAGESSPELNLLLARLDISEKKPRDAIERLNEDFGKDLNATYISVLKEAAIIAARGNDFVTADRAFQILANHTQDPEIFMLHGRATMARAVTEGFDANAKTAADLFRKALDGSKGRVADNPQLSIVALELAEALFTSGDYLGAESVADEFLRSWALADSDKSVVFPRLYMPVAKLISLASRYVTEQLTEPPLELMDRELKSPLEYPELWVTVPRSSGEPLKIRVGRWRFSAFDTYVCTHLMPPKRDIVVALSTSVQKKVGQQVEEGCERTRK